MPKLCQSFCEVTPLSLKVVGAQCAHRLNFKLVFECLLLNCWRSIVSIGVCISKPWSFSSTSKNLMGT